MKILTLIIIPLVFLQSINAQTDSCTVLLEKISGKYTGNCLDGLANGKGESIGDDTYIGSFKNGLPHGKGKYIYKNGDVYLGYWKNGQKHGKGKFNYSLNTQKFTLTGYWKMDEYAGLTDPDVSFRVTSVSGINNYNVEKNESAGESDKEITFSVKSAFMDFSPMDLKFENSSGQIILTGKKLVINQYFCPLHCEVSYSILTGESRKQCRFIFDILEEGNYMITLYND
jgi:hypothetical protein